MAARATYIAGLLDVHLEELGFLWGRWRAALRDPRYALDAVAALEERIQGHLQGLLVPGDKAVPRLLERLGSDDPELAFAAAYALLHRRAPETTARVLESFLGADGEVFHALKAALAYGPLPASGLERVRAHLGDTLPARGLAAAEVLVFHREPALLREQLRYFLEDDDPATRLAGWRLAALLGAQLEPESYARAMRDPEPTVAAAGLEAGAWCGVSGVLAALRQLVQRPGPERLEELYLLAVLGTPEDVPALLALTCEPALGPERFRLAGAFGHPGCVPVILQGMEAPDPATAAAAGAAFARMTGVDISTDQRAMVPPADGAEPDWFGAEFLEEVVLPDPVRARREWEALRPRMEHGCRLRRGVDVARVPGAEAFAGLDMQSRRELLLREAFHHRWTGTPLVLEWFPQASR